MSKPILGDVSMFAIIAAWKDFLWPIIPVALFRVFQGVFLRSAGLGGAVKG